MAPERQPLIAAFLHHLTAAVANAGLYSREHVQMRRLVGAVADALAQLLEGTEEFLLLRLDNELVIDGLPWKRSLQTERLAALMSRRGIGRIRIAPSITPEEIHGLIEALAGRGLNPPPVRSSTHLRFGRVEVRRRSDAFLDLPPDSPLAELSRGEISRLMEIYSAVKRRQKMNVVGLNEMVSHFIAAFSQEADPFLALAPLRALDEYTFTHATNVALLNLAQAVALGIEGQALHDIGIAGLLHDVGKLFIPDSILNKKEPLDELEWGIIRQHPLQGARYLLNSPGVPRAAVVSAFEHHLRYDRQGYPAVRNQWAQNLCSQLTAISDLVDSMLTPRPYRSAQSVREVVKALKANVGGSLHPQLVNNFLRILVQAKKRDAENTRSA
ncbi:HD-GYP domain-containing protein [Geoalkalibacter sp.]|uniref:HD-GYP domain-containing protein n=1 Tax=Geoalkalibacter sp. TaxID=3041440 RepID=UPI00272E2932|nr:HD domain-containing phosphohydrolase [Geoalkalibacter sp.]